MAKVKRPLMSHSASGSIGKSLIYTSALKRGIVKGFFVSKDKSTEDQLYIRSVFNAGVAEWKSMTPEEKAAYNLQSKGKILTGYNIFIKNYMKENYNPENYGVYENSYYEDCFYAPN